MIFQDVLDHLEVETSSPHGMGRFMRRGWLGEKTWIEMRGNILLQVTGELSCDFQPSGEDKKADDWKRYFDAPAPPVTETVQSSIEPQTSKKSEATVESKKEEDKPKKFGTPKDRALKIESIEDIREWIAAHGAQMEAYWDQQFRWNKRVEEWKYNYDTRLTALERRVFWLCGAASAAGAVIGNMIGG